MRHLADVIYYQLYRWYDLISIKRIFDPDPYYTAFGTFGLFLGVFLFNIINILINILIYMYIGNTILLPIYIYIVTILIGFRISYLLFRKKKRYIQIVKKKPLLKNSVPLSIFITIIYFILTGLSFVWHAMIIEIFLKK